MSVLYGKKHCASCEFWSGVREPDACAERSRCGAYTKHHLKFGKIKPTVLDICDFGADFFLYFIGV